MARSGKSEGSSRDEGAGGGFAKCKGYGGAFGGSTAELEREARAMIRKGEINPFELRTLVTANALHKMLLPESLVISRQI